ncbi:glycosyltransferase [Achromobacter deleyi]|uniref:glycosyltransferase n=1 Tax=Achromobacter deleyi TaxID=1353891 RepID=UPI001491563C|nr:glycosyltransferase [Achromobacter deleyi]QVQ29259.1 glycosyltransferase [Achromobacter deleyi]UIP19381.1 glycosyltransferase [Achromobacter deleyi]
MNILYTNYHSGTTIGGHTIYVVSLLRALAQRHRLTVAVPGGSSLHRLAGGVPGVHVVAQDYPSRLGKRLAAARALRRVILAQQIDVVHVNGSSDHRTVILACMGLGKRRPRIVLTKHNDIPISYIGAALRTRVGTDHVIGVCDFVERMLHASPYAARPVSTIANGVDIERYSPWTEASASVARARLLGEHAAKCTLLLGSNAGTNSYKGWMDMVRAVVQLGPRAAGVYIALAGAAPDAEQKQELEALKMSDRVIFAGVLDDVRPFLAALDLGFVLSYRVETISFACREMMSMGLPVIVSDQGGLPENIEAGVDGWIVPKRDPEAVAGVLAGILDDPGCVERMGAAARAKSVAEFGLEQFARRTEQVYLSLARTAP